MLQRGDRSFHLLLLLQVRGGKAAVGLREREEERQTDGQPARPREGQAAETPGPAHAGSSLASNAPPLSLFILSLSLYFLIEASSCSL